MVEVKKTKKPFKVEHIHFDEKGNQQYVEVHGYPIFNAEGEVIQMIEYSIDITERKKMELAIEEANKRMGDELNVARDIQMSMLPLIFPAFPKRREIDIFANLIPAREVGGDFYDFYFIDEDRFCFTVGDVSGKGVPGALMMAVTKTLLKSRAGTDESTASILTHVNNEIARENDAYMFITVFIAILDISTGEMVYSNAGHNPSFILHEAKGELTKLSELHGPVVGAMEEMTFTESKLKLSKGDLVLAYTDGITESQNHDEELYSDKRFVKLLGASLQLGPKELIDKILKDVKAFENGAEQFDDITTLAIQMLVDPSSSSGDRISLEIKNRLEEINYVVDRFESFGMNQNIPLPMIHKCNIAFDELLNNIISYGYKDDAEHKIRVEIELKSQRLMITIIDDGFPFNPFKKDPPDTKLSIEERNIGGLGIHIVKNLMDEYRYVRNVDKNVITLIKHNINFQGNET
jgi:sigma-B regulation protein RsbU (phosphoserine phosphatase)